MPPLLAEGRRAGDGCARRRTDQFKFAICPRLDRRALSSPRRCEFASDGFHGHGCGRQKLRYLFAKARARSNGSIQGAKAEARGRVFAAPEFGAAIRQLESEKEQAVKRGDAIIRQIQEDLVAHFEALVSQGTLDATTRKL